MRRVKYQEFKDKVKKESFLVLRMMNRRAPRRRPRDPEEAELLAHLAELSWSQAIASGRLEKRGARHYRLNVNVK